jgi:hypothetical protein
MKCEEATVTFKSSNLNNNNNDLENPNSLRNYQQLDQKEHHQHQHQQQYQQSAAQKEAIFVNDLKTFLEENEKMLMGDEENDQLDFDNDQQSKLIQLDQMVFLSYFDLKLIYYIC